jgi:hypothetical protein
MRGFDSVSHTLSLLSNNLDNALQVYQALGLSKDYYYYYYYFLIMGIPGEIRGRYAKHAQYTGWI